jgi:hypothetical protein
MTTRLDKMVSDIFEMPETLVSLLELGTRAMLFCVSPEI